MNGRRVAVAGAYSTKQAQRLESTSVDVVLDAVHGALADAGLSAKDVDGMAVDWPGPGGLPNESSSWAKLLGIDLRWWADGRMDCAGVRGLAKAASAVASGLCEVVVVGGGQAGMFRAGSGINPDVHVEFSDCWGNYVVPSLALLAQRHMYEFGTTADQLAEVAATIRNHGSVNPEAVMFGRGPYTPEDVLASKLISEPFHLLDICIVAEGGSAIVVTTEERARDLAQPVIGVLGIGMEATDALFVNPPLLREVGLLGARAAKRAFGASGVSPTDVDIFSLYDPTSFEVIRQFEMMGLCAQGEGGSFVESGAIAHGGPFPTNLDGGTLSYSWVGTQQLTQRVVEAVRQLRGTASGLQAENAEVAAVGNGAGHIFHYEFTVLAKR